MGRYLTPISMWIVEHYGIIIARSYQLQRFAVNKHSIQIKDDGPASLFHSMSRYN